MGESFSATKTTLWTSISFICFPNKISSYPSPSKGNRKKFLSPFLDWLLHYVSIESPLSLQLSSTCLPVFFLILWRRQWQPTPVLLPRKPHGWRILVDYSPWGHKESDMTEWLHFHFSFFLIEFLCSYHFPNLVYICTKAYIWASLVAQLVKNPCNAGDPGSIPGLVRSPGKANGSPLQYSFLENSRDRAGQATVNDIARVGLGCATNFDFHFTSSRVTKNDQWVDFFSTFLSK